MSELLYSIHDLFSSQGFLSTGGKSHYNIPLYQRGYKWQPKHVSKLLDDIYQFDHKDDKFYCLQNITIVPNENAYNVVDGQQRLTTLSLILNYLEEQELIKGKVGFPNNSIRRHSNKFINEVIFENLSTVLDTSWDDFIEKHPDYDHQDIYHMYAVLQSIDEWFGSRPGNLNSKRIPLDGADLIRAMLITRVVYEEGKKETDVKNIVRVNERRIKIGWVIDQTNNWWSQNEVLGFFSGLLSMQDKKLLLGLQFNFELHPINLLYFLYAQSIGESLSIEFYEEQNNQPIKLYRNIIKLHETLRDWFQDREIYHFLGYLIFQDKDTTDFIAIWKMWTQSADRKTFKQSLKSRIKKSLIDQGQLLDFRDTDFNWYKQNKEKLVQGLILMDLIHSLKNNQSRIPYAGFTKKANDIEHIFPQKPADPDDIESYVDFLNQHIVEGGKHRFKYSKLKKELNEEEFEIRVEAFISRITEGYKIHAIGNLVLLNSSLNRSISNSSYSYKRARIIDYYNRGNYIQPHTFHVFVRYFNDLENRNNDFEHWSQKDITDNSEAIALAIKGFFEEADV